MMVEHESDTYYVYSKDTMALPETIRADGAESNRATFNLSTASYVLSEHALHDDITDRQRGNVDKAIKLDIDVTEDLTRKIMLRREVDLQSIVQTAANWANTLSLTVGAAWNSYTTTSNPITQIDSASSVILLNSGLRPNVLAINDLSFNALKENPTLVDRVKYTSAESIGDTIIARLFNLPKLLTAQVTYNTGQEGLADSMSRVWNDNAFLAYVESSPGLKRPSALYSMWKNNTGFPQMVEKWREPKIKADRIEVSAFFQNKVVASDCAYLIVDTVQ